MVESFNERTHSCTVKQFAIDEDHSFVQYSVQMPEPELDQLVTGGNAPAPSGKNKILVQALDVSGSMSGSPINALKIGAELIGERYYAAEEKPFERFITYLYESRVR